MTAYAVRAVGLDQTGGVERQSAWPWTASGVGSLSGEGGGPTGIVQGPGTLNPVGNGKLADVAGSITPGVVQTRSSARLPSARTTTVVAGGRRSWPLG